jgi:cell division protein YceG involved in septum cleavage
MLAVIMVIIAFILVVIAFAILFVVYKVNKFKNKAEDAVIDGVKQVIVEQGPEAVKYVKNKIEKK